MKIIKKMLNFIDKKYSWDTLGDDIKKELLKRSCALIFLIFTTIYIALSIKDLNIVFMFLIIDIGYFFFLYYTLLLFEYEKYISVEGIILKIVNNTRKTRLKGLSFGKCSMIVQVQNILVEVPVSMSSKYKKGVHVKIYTLDKNVIQIESDYFKILSPLTVSITKNIDAYTLFDNQKEIE